MYRFRLRVIVLEQGRKIGMTLRHSLRKMLWKIGYDVSPFRPDTNPLARRRRLIEEYAIDIVLDVGANTGQYAMELRNDLKFRGDIVSFEPLSSAFKQLERNARSDHRWRTLNCALGDTEGTTEINISNNSYSSSILDMLPKHVESAPDSVYGGRETIVIRKLDSIFESICAPDSKIYLKMDVQGFESKVIKGAENALRRIGTVQLEMSLAPLYEGEFQFGEMHDLMLAKGYHLVSLEPGFSDKGTGQMLQVDGIYRRR